MGIRFRKTKKAGPFRFSLTKKGVGWSIGNKYIGYSHGASGRKSLRASIPGTGISYITPIFGRKKRKSSPARKSRQKITAQTEPNKNVRYSEMPKKKKNGDKKGILNNKVVATVAAIFIGIAALESGTNDAETPETTKEVNAESIATMLTTSKSIETEYLETVPPETKPEPETEPPETKKPETKAPETKPPETKEPKDKAPVVIVKPETQPPETKKPETKPPETKKPETQPPETEPPITITHKDSSLSPELVKALDGVAAFWAPTGNRIHLNPFCRHFQGTVYAGTVEEANSVKDGGWCGTCSKNANENTKSNVNATPKVIADCYSYQDYLNQIPATAFD